MGAGRSGSIPEISERLRHTAELVSPGITFADIGTDHAYLPIYLVETLRNPGGFATDAVSGPLLRAEKNIGARGLDGSIRLLRGDGLTVLSPGDAGSLVMAGMGGRLMMRILEESMETAMSFQEMILQPQSEIRDVRLWIYHHGWHITAEDMVRDSGKYYFMMKAVPGREDVPDESSLRYGPCLTAGADPILHSYLLREKTKKKNILIQLDPVNERCRRRQEELENDIHIIDDLTERCFSEMPSKIKEGNESCAAVK